MSEDAYGLELLAAAQELAPVVKHVSVRGEAAARFLFADRGDRAVELSRSGLGFWVEFWAENPEDPVADRTFADLDGAVAACLHWFQEDCR